MSETRYDRLADEFDAMRLSILCMHGQCVERETRALDAGSRSAYKAAATWTAEILSKYPQKNFPKGTP